jgi:class 3 adenylate cyclase
MEKNAAILMADLSGYSALTETHGSVTAADLIDKYISLAENCLVGDCILHQQTGDEIMFISDSSDVMLATAKQLAANTAKVEYFLQVHGGLHYGPVLKRGTNYFGSTVNLTARIAAKAVAGTFYCSAEFKNSITDKSICIFQPRGNHSLKNINEEKELFELDIDKMSANFIDPVCRMLILQPANAFRHPNEEIYFCSPQCLTVYKENQAVTQDLKG